MFTENEDATTRGGAHLCPSPGNGNWTPRPLWTEQRMGCHYALVSNVPAT